MCRSVCRLLLSRGQIAGSRRKQALSGDSPRLPQELSYGMSLGLHLSFPTSLAVLAFFFFCHLKIIFVWGEAGGGNLRVFFLQGVEMITQVSGVLISHSHRLIPCQGSCLLGRREFVEGQPGSWALRSC